MAYKVVQFRRGTTAENNLFVGAPGELSVNTDNWTAIVHDGHTAGGHPLQLEATEYARVRYLIFRAAAVQQGQASLGFSSPLNAGPLPVIIADNDILIGAASFDQNNNQSVQDHFMLPTNWVAPLNLDMIWRADTTIGTVIWQIDTCCVANGGTLIGQNFSNPQQVSTIVDGISNRIATSTIEIDTSTFISDGELFFRLTRLAGSDTVDVPVELLSLRFSIHIQEK